jgi:ferredoxin-NADP reductase
MPPPTLVTFPVRRVVRATSRAVLLTLATENRPYHFVPGQAVWLGPHGNRVRKPYSIASSPADACDRGVLEFLIATDRDQPSGHLTGSAGDAIDVEGPVGSFVLPEPLPASHLLLFAGGTGIAPLRAMWRHLANRETRPRMTLAYSGRTLADVAFVDEIGDLATSRLMDVVITLSREGPSGMPWRTGRFDLEVVRSLTGTGDAIAFVCGPPGFVTDVAAMLGACGLAAGRIVTSP